MIQLMTVEQHRKFSALKAEMDTKFENILPVFVPMGPAPSKDFPIRILFVGQAVNGLNWFKPSLADYETACGATHDEIAQCAPGRSGPFWQVVHDITAGVYKSLGIALPHDRFDDVIGFSNIAKIPKRSVSPPKGGALLIQSALCLEQMKFEIETMNPNAVVLLSALCAQKAIVEPIFGGEDQWSFDTPEKNCVAYRMLGGRKIVWTNHPRNMGRSGTRAASVRTAIDFIVGNQN